MRLFDIAGLLFVALWIVSVGAFVFVALDDDKAQGLALTDGIVDLQEDTTWMAIYREGQDAGVLREDRTRLIDGWLIELQGIVELDLLGDSQVFRFSSRSTLNEDLTLRSATGDVEAFGMELQMTGQYRDANGDSGFYVNVVIDDSSRQFVADLEERPRLANYAIPEILAREDLEVGDRFQQEFFDPLTLSPSYLELTYDGKEEIETVDDRQEAHNFLQSAGTFDTRIYTDDWGMPLVQILPMQVAVRRLPDQLGPSHFHAFQEIFEESSGDAPAFVSAIDADDLLALVARFGSGQIDRLRPATDGDEELFAGLDDGSDDDEATSQTREFTLRPLPEDQRLDLIAYDQHLAMQSADSARVERVSRNSLWHAGHAPEDSKYEPSAGPDDDENVAKLAEKLSEIIEFDSDDDVGDDPKPIDVDTVAALVAEHCDDDDEPACLTLVADVFSALGLGPHFVHGAVVSDGGRLEARTWLVFFSEGHYLGAIDPVPGAGVGRDHLQLYLEDEYSPEALADLLEAIEID